MTEVIQEPKEILEDAMDVMNETLDMMENVRFKINKKMVVGVAIGSLVAGALIGYLVAKKRERAKYTRRVEKEIAEAREFYSARLKTGEFADPVKLAEKYVENSEMAELREITRDYQSDDTTGVQGEMDQANGESTAEAMIPEEVVEIFREQQFNAEEEDPNWNYEYELRHRTEEAPYVISYEEYMENEKERPQSALAYYEADDVLADEADKPIDNTDRVVGDYNLQRFGHGSKDNNVVYIRNEVLDHEFEVVRHRGSYVEQVLGFIQHGDRHHKLRKFRSDDD